MGDIIHTEVRFKLCTAQNPSTSVLRHSNTHVQYNANPKKTQRRAGKQNYSDNTDTRFGNMLNGWSQMGDDRLIPPSSCECTPKERTVDLTN
jgi:hypothetical protein